MISDENIRSRLASVGFSQNPVRRSSGPAQSARRGTMEFEVLMEDLLAEWELEDEELENITEVRRAGDSFEIRLKGSGRWELLEDDEEEDDEDFDSESDEDFDEEE